MNNQSVSSCKKNIQTLAGDHLWDSDKFLIISSRIIEWKVIDIRLSIYAIRLVHKKNKQILHDLFLVPSFPHLKVLNLGNNEIETIEPLSRLNCSIS